MSRGKEYIRIGDIKVQKQILRKAEEALFGVAYRVDELHYNWKVEDSKTGRLLARALVRDRSKGFPPEADCVILDLITYKNILGIAEKSREPMLFICRIPDIGDLWVRITKDLVVNTCLGRGGHGRTPTSPNYRGDPKDSKKCIGIYLKDFVPAGEDFNRPYYKSGDGPRKNNWGSGGSDWFRPDMMPRA